MGFDIMNIMKQVQNAQKKAEQAQQELAALEITGEAAGGAVKVVCDGQGKFKSIKIAASVINPENPESVDTDTLETIEDVISAAIIQASEKASAEMASKMKQITGNISIPGLKL